MTTHRHSISGKYTSYTNVPIPDVSGLATKAELDALTARVLALETPPTPPPPIQPAPGSVTVRSIADMLTARANPGYSEVILADGRYQSGYLDLGLVRTATNPVVVRAQTDGGAILDFRGGSSGLLWRNGLAYEEWRGFGIDNIVANDGGALLVGEGTGTPVHHLILRRIALLAGVKTGPGPSGNYQNGQGLYLSWANGEGNHDILVEDFTSSADVWAAIHVYHDEKGSLGHDITIRRPVIDCSGAHAKMGIVHWSGRTTNWLYEDGRITGAKEYAFRHAVGGGSTLLRRMTSTGSGSAGYYSSAGSAGITQDSCSFG